MTTGSCRHQSKKIVLYAPKRPTRSSVRFFGIGSRDNRRAPGSRSRRFNFHAIHQVFEAVVIRVLVGVGGSVGKLTGVFIRPGAVVVVRAPYGASKARSSMAF